MNTRTWITLAMLMLAAACGDNTAPVVPVATTVTVTPAEVALGAEGETAQLTASVLDQNGAPIIAAIVWIAANETVATVEPSGLLTAIGEGSTTITVMAGAAVGYARVVVEYVPAEIIISPELLVIAGIGGKGRFEALVLDASGSPLDIPVVWDARDPLVGSIDQNGVVTGIGPGFMAVLAKTGGVTGTATVEVRVSKPVTMLDDTFDGNRVAKGWFWIGGTGKKLEDDKLIFWKADGATDRNEEARGYYFEFLDESNEPTPIGQWEARATVRREAGEESLSRANLWIVMAGGGLVYVDFYFSPYGEGCTHEWAVVQVWYRPANGGKRKQVPVPSRCLQGLEVGEYVSIGLQLAAGGYHLLIADHTFFIANPADGPELGDLVGIELLTWNEEEAIHVDRVTVRGVRR